MGTSGSAVTFQINKNDELFMNGYATNSGWATHSVSLVMYLERGDQTYVKHRTSRIETVHGDKVSYFSGVFLQ